MTAGSGSGVVRAVCGDTPASTFRRIPASASSECPWARAERSTSAIASSRGETDGAATSGSAAQVGTSTVAVMFEEGAMT